MLKIKSYSFNDELKSQLLVEEKGTNWPVVYLLNNEKELYIGESSNVQQRMSNHLKNKERLKLKQAHIIYDDTFNKSAILDIESLLIQYMGADCKYKLQNRNNGQSRNHNYYQREKYINSFELIWEKLQQMNLVINNKSVIENSDLFKFSPYKDLTDEQYEISKDILQRIDNGIKDDKKYSFFIHGGAGTGKSVLAVYLVKRIVDIANGKYNDDDLTDNEKISFKNLKNKKVGIVVAMTSFRNSLKKVFKKTPGLTASMVLSPNDVAKKQFDILVVDESHRLMQRKNLTNYKAFDDVNTQLNLNNGDQLDWIKKSSNYQIFFYDYTQSIKPSDVSKESFDKVISEHNTIQYYLTTQLRSNGGNDFIEYINQIFSNNPPKIRKNFDSDNFEVKIFDDVKVMVNEIKEKNTKYGLCRIVSGYSWPWNTKGYTYNEIKEKKLYDITIDSNHYIWNTTISDWVNSEHSIDEIGCIHTIQGYDLNYVGVIIGKDLLYRDSKLIIDREHYYDKNGKRSIKSDEELKNYIINIYKVLLTRGIKGVYLYICDDELYKYLKKYL